MPEGGATETTADCLLRRGAMVKKNLFVSCCACLFVALLSDSVGEWRIERVKFLIPSEHVHFINIRHARREFRALEPRGPSPKSRVDSPTVVRILHSRVLVN